MGLSQLDPCFELFRDNNAFDGSDHFRVNSYSEIELWKDGGCIKSFNTFTQFEQYLRNESDRKDKAKMRAIALFDSHSEDEIQDIIGYVKLIMDGEDLGDH